MTKQESLDKIFKNKPTERKNQNENKNEETNSDEYILKFDGCSKGNPGPAGAGAVIYKNGDIHWKSAAYVGKKETNNVAEYVGMLIGLQEAVKKNIREIAKKNVSKNLMKPSLLRTYKPGNDHYILLKN